MLPAGVVLVACVLVVLGLVLRWSPGTPEPPASRTAPTPARKRVAMWVT